MEQSIPDHMNLFQRSQTVYWSGSDRYEVWLTHMKDSNSRNYLERMGWDHEHAIEYKFNSCGFRDDEFDQRDNCLAIGCSFTEGVGLRADQIWPSKLTRLINTHVWNLGIGGASADTCFRMLDHYIKVLNPKAVFFLIPPLMRVELHSEDEIRSYLVTDEDVESFVKVWFAHDGNGAINRYKNVLAMKQICADRGIQLYMQDSMERNSTDDADMANNDMARDLMHYGEETQDHIAKEFYRDYVNGNS